MSDPYLDGIMQKVMATGQEVVVEDAKAANPAGAPANALVEKALNAYRRAVADYVTSIKDRRPFERDTDEAQKAGMRAAISIVVEECAKVAETAWTEFAGTPETAVLNCHRDIAAAIRSLDAHD